MPTPHKHAELIKAWADGAEIEFYGINSCAWKPTNPKQIFWDPNTQYRIKPHKWQKEMDAYKAGKAIQYRPHDNVEWDNCPVMFFNDPTGHYRVKPETVKYRMFFWKPGRLGGSEVVLAMVTKEENDRESRESWSGFVSWVSDWQEAEIPST